MVLVVERHGWISRRICICSNDRPLSLMYRQYLQLWQYLQLGQQSFGFSDFDSDLASVSSASSMHLDGNGKDDSLEVALDGFSDESSLSSDDAWFWMWQCVFERMMMSPASHLVMC